MGETSLSPLTGAVVCAAWRLAPPVVVWVYSLTHRSIWRGLVGEKSPHAWGESSKRRESGRRAALTVRKKRERSSRLAHHSGALFFCGPFHTAMVPPRPAQSPYRSDLLKGKVCV